MTTMTKTREIPRAEWMGFLDGLSRDHRGDVVNVQFADPELGYQMEMRQLPLVGVSADLKAGGGPRVEVIVGRAGVYHTAHAVLDPKVVRVEEDGEGRPQVLEIEAAGGVKTLVMLRPGDMGEPGEGTQR
jgi:hypothetical protein